MYMIRWRLIANETYWFCGRLWSFTTDPSLSFLIVDAQHKPRTTTTRNREDRSKFRRWRRLVLCHPPNTPPNKIFEDQIPRGLKLYLCRRSIFHTHQIRSSSFRKTRSPYIQVECSYFFATKFQKDSLRRLLSPNSFLRDSSQPPRTTIDFQ